jgi:hypothetical protein
MHEPPQVGPALIRVLVFIVVSSYQPLGPLPAFTPLLIVSFRPFQV